MLARKKNASLRNVKELFRRKKVNDTRGWSNRMMKKLEMLKEAENDGSEEV